MTWDPSGENEPPLSPWDRAAPCTYPSLVARYVSVPSASRTKRSTDRHGNSLFRRRMTSFEPSLDQASGAPVSVLSWIWLFGSSGRVGSTAQIPSSSP